MSTQCYPQRWPLRDVKLQSRGPGGIVPPVTLLRKPAPLPSLLASPVSRLLVLVTGVLLAACEPRVDVNATANVPAGYASVLITVEEIWFNESATAVPADTTWQKFELDDTVTIDLVDVTGGELTSIASDLKVAAGTYRHSSR